MDSEETETDTNLMASPQRLGVLPTMSFWQDAGVRRIVGLPFSLLVLILAVVGFAVRFDPLLETAVLLVAYFGGLGLLERYVRAGVLRRRELAAGERPALGEGEGLTRKTD